MIATEVHTVWNCSLQIEISNKISQSSALYDRPPTTDASDVQSSIYRGHVAIAITILTSDFTSFAGPPIKSSRFHGRHVNCTERSLLSTCAERKARL